MTKLYTCHIVKSAEVFSAPLPIAAARVSRSPAEKLTRLNCHAVTYNIMRQSRVRLAKCAPRNNLNHYIWLWLLARKCATAIATARRETH